MSFSIYMIRNLVTDKVYVGQTVKTFEERCAEHKRQLKRGAHSTPALQADWNQLGAEAFEFTLLRLYEIRASLIGRCRIERDWMNRLQSLDPRYGYNLPTGRRPQ